MATACTLCGLGQGWVSQIHTNVHTLQSGGLCTPQQMDESFPCDPSSSVNHNSQSPDYHLLKEHPFSARHCAK